MQFLAQLLAGGVRSVWGIYQQPGYLCVILGKAWIKIKAQIVLFYQMCCLGPAN